MAVERFHKFRPTIRFVTRFLLVYPSFNHNSDVKPSCHSANNLTTTRELVENHRLTCLVIVISPQILILSPTLSKLLYNRSTTFPVKLSKVICRKVLLSQFLLPLGTFVSPLLYSLNDRFEIRSVGVSEALRCRYSPIIPQKARNIVFCTREFSLMEAVFERCSNRVDNPSDRRDKLLAPEWSGEQVVRLLNSRPSSSADDI